jgi:hypothetical protein
MRGVHSRGQKLAGAVALTLALLPSAGSANTQTAPKNTGEPQILGTAVEGRILTATTGTWSGSTPLSFTYRWLRCPSDGGTSDGSNCAVIPGETRSSYRVRPADVGLRLRARVRATNPDGAARAASNPASVVLAAASKPRPAPTGCPGGSGTAGVEQLTPPARLLVDGMQVSPSVIASSTPEIVVRFHVSACQGRSVHGALLYAATVPFNQFSVPPEQPTGADGWVTLSMRRLSGFPAARRQQLLVMFVRARKPGESVLAGISARRLVSFRVNLSS